MVTSNKNCSSVLCASYVPLTVPNPYFFLKLCFSDRSYSSSVWVKNALETPVLLPPIPLCCVDSTGFFQCIYKRAHRHVYKFCS